MGCSYVRNRYITVQFQCCWCARRVTMLVIYIERARRLLPESVVWLCANNRIAEAEQIIRNAAKMNNITMPDRILANSLTIEIIDITDDDVSRKGGKSVKKFSQLENLRLERITDRSSRYTIIDIFRNRRLTINVLCMMLLWSVISYKYLLTFSSVVSGEKCSWNLSLGALWTLKLHCCNYIPLSTHNNYYLASFRARYCYTNSVRL